MITNSDRSLALLRKLVAEFNLTFEECAKLSGTTKCHISEQFTGRAVQVNQPLPYKIGAELHRRHKIVYKNFKHFNIKTDLHKVMKFLIIGQVSLGRELNISENDFKKLCAAKLILTNWDAKFRLYRIKFKRILKRRIDFIENSFKNS